MSLLLFRVVLFSLVPVGGGLLLKGIRLVAKNFNGRVLLELPYLQKKGTFKVEKAGHYALWHAGPLLRKVPVGDFFPKITHSETGKQVALHRSLTNYSTNNGTTARALLFRFEALPGTYSLDLVAGSGLTQLETFLSRLVPLKKADPARYKLQVRECVSPLAGLWAAVLIVLGVACVVGGAVVGGLLPQIVR